MKRYLISSTNLATILRAYFKSSTLYSGLYVLLVAAITFVGCAEKYDDSAIVERLDKLEGTTIKDINGQISAINKTIDDLKAFDSYFESYTNNTIDSIQDVLRDYVDNNLSTTTDWCSATFATLEKYNMTVSDLVLLEQRVAIMDSTYNDTIAAINQKIEQAIFDMRDWVNTCFTNYYNIAQIDAKLVMLESKVKDADSTSKARIAQLYTNLDSTQAALTRSYKEAISSAIETNNGVINSHIADEIDAVNTHINNEIGTINLRIASLEGRVSALEERVDELSKQLGIRFSDNNVSCSPGDNVNIDYTLINATDTTEVYALPSNGYKAKVIKSSKSAGTISVTIPNPIEDGTVLIFVNNGDRTVTKSLNFISGTMSISVDAVMADADGEDISVDLSTDLQYTVKIPAEATWVHYKDITTKSAMRNETINFTVDENVLSAPRSAVVELVNGSGLTIGSVTIRQGCNVLQPNEIWYTSTDGNIVTPYNDKAFGANIVSNVYGKSKGVITFDSSVKRIGYQAFNEISELNSISLPGGVISIGEYAFSLCYGLSFVIIPNGVTTIDNCAFLQCMGLSTITIPESVTNIGVNAFASCSGLKSITIPSSVLTIASSAFYGCSGLNKLEINEGVKEIGTCAFQECSNIESVSFPQSIINIGHSAFGYCTSLKLIDISHLNYVQDWSATFTGCENIETIIMTSNGFYKNTFENCTRLKNVYVKGYPPQVNNEVFKHIEVEELTLIVPKDTKRFYENTEVFKDFGTTTEDESIVLNNPDAVDLGLSVKWASFNVGAQVPEQPGFYLAWGELYPKVDYTVATYKWYEGSDNNLTKYNNDESRGLIDNKTLLDLSDDAANYYLGGDWRTPTDAEWNELFGCIWTRTTLNGISGFLVESNKSGYEGHSIFLPAAGYRDFSGLNVSPNGNGYYWSSILYTGNPNQAQGLYYYSKYYEKHNFNRYNGNSVRAVCPSESWLSSCTITMSKDSRTCLLNKTYNLVAIVKHNDEVFNARINWESDNPSVATVDANGVVSAKSKGTAHITASYETLSAQCTITVVEEESEIEHEYVDLGLKVKWATFNVGATSEDDYGDYYAWGETSNKNMFEWANYKYCKGTQNSLTKYCGDSERGFNGFIDNLTTLELDDDVAHVKWGGNWRMPTNEEYYDLFNEGNCRWTWTSMNGVEGYKISSKIPGYENNYIFLPASGLMTGDSNQYENSGCYGVSNSVVHQEFFQKSGGFWGMVSDIRYYGLTVRPVCP